MKHRFSTVLSGLLLAGTSLLANQPGGGNGTGPAVTITDNGSTVTLANGILTLVCTKASATISQINYTYNNSGSTVTNQLLLNGKDGGEFYWETGGWGSGSFNYSVVANTGDYCEIDLLSTSPTTNGVMDVHYSLLRGATGFYVTAIWQHRAGDGAIGMGETRDNIYLNPEFTWNTIDANRNFQYNLGGAGGGGTGGAVGVFGAPVEVSLWTNGIAQGRYEDKYKYVADFGTERVWGWSSVNNPAAGFTGQNIGIWHVLASAEYYNGGPMKPELMCAPMVNMLNGGHYYMGNDSEFGQGEVWTRVQGPYFIYCNNVTNTSTGPFQAAEALYNDALVQATAEQGAWPYSWFTNANYAAPSQRGSVSGQLVIADSGNPNASASNMWVGVVQQPTTINGVYDSQLWMKPYQFWVQTDSNGNFTIPAVTAGNNYTLWSFGPGINGTFLSQSQSGNYPSLLYTLPTTPFSVTVTAGATNNLGAVVWTNASRVGATVFEIGYPDRTARKFRHGEDWWVGDVGPSPTNPIPVWSKFLEYPFDFPNGPNYVVGQSRWATDWNFIQPNVVDNQGNMSGSTSTITFNLATAPANGATASIYIGLASDDAGPLIVSVNGQNLSSAPGLVAAPVTSIPSTGYFPIGFSSTYSIGYSTSDTSIREGINAAFSDERLTFNASLLQSGQNTITINMRKGGSLDNHAMYDYIRLELTGYVPPPPASASAFAGNNCNLVFWPMTPGATSYNILRSTNSGSGYVSLTNGVTGPVCGSGWNNATFVDTTAANGTAYYYVVQSANPGGVSTNSPSGAGATPAPDISTDAPPAPTGLTVTAVAHQSVTLNWSAAPGADFYTIYRSTLVDTLGGASNVLRTIVLNNNTTGTSYTDTALTDGSIYSYAVTATSAGGISGSSAAAVGVPLPAPPSSVPGSLTGHFVQVTNILLSWSAVSGAVGYDIFRATSSGGPFALASGYVDCITETTYTDTGLTPGTYYYRVVAVNAAGVSSPANATVVAPPAAPVSLSAIPGDTLVTLSWSAVSGAAGYYLYGGTVSNNVTSLVTANYSGTSFTNTGLTDGTTYYYLVAATNAAALGPFSPEASATPSAVVAATRNLTWKGDGSANLWNVAGAANWLSNATATTFNNGDTATFDNSGSNNVPVNIASAVQPGLVIVTNAATHAYTFSGAGSIAGTNALVKYGPGALTLGTTNTYAGGTTVSNGLLTFSIAQAIPSTGRLSLYNTGAVTVVSASSLPNVLVNGTNAVTGNGNSGTGIAALDVEGTLNLLVSGGSKVFDLTGPMTGPGTLVLANASSMTLRFNGTVGDASAIFNLGTVANFASVRSTSTTGIALGGLAGAAGVQLQGDNSGGGANLTYSIGGAAANAEFDGVIVDGTVGTVAVVKTGGNAQTLTGANSYTAGTVVNGGTLQASNTLGSATGTGPVTVNSGGTLSGAGIISGAVTVNAGGTLTPGKPLGALTLSNLLTLNPGSTTSVAVSHSPFTNSLVRVIGAAVTEGGTLVASNSSGAAFVSGDHFTLLSAAGYNGAYSGFILPSLNPGLGWNATRLKVDGSLWVVSTNPPNLGTAQVVANKLVLNGTGGTPNWYYYVLSSTNPALPLANWTRIATNQYDSVGNFVISNTIDPSLPATFLRLQQQ